jgi:hypothetical protein
MSLNAGSARLARGSKNLRVAWETVKDLWSDSASDEFERRHMAVLDELSQSTLREMDRLGNILQQAQMECR